MVIGAGVNPDVMLARSAGLDLGDTGGVRVDSRLESATPGVYAAGDVAEYESVVHGGRRIRVEHWDVAFNQGKTAALNMLGKGVDHDVVPYFFSDLSDWAAIEYVGPAYDWDREVIRGSTEDGAFSSSTSRRPRRRRPVGRPLRGSPARPPLHRRGRRDRRPRRRARRPLDGPRHHLVVTPVSTFAPRGAAGGCQARTQDPTCSSATRGSEDKAWRRQTYLECERICGRGRWRRVEAPWRRGWWWRREILKRHVARSRFRDRAICGVNMTRVSGRTVQNRRVRALRFQHRPPGHPGPVLDGRLTSRALARETVLRQPRSTSSVSRTQHGQTTFSLPLR